MTCNIGANSPKVGSFMSFNDLQTGSARGSSVLLDGTVDSNYPNISSAVQNMTAPPDGDHWTNTHFSIALNDIHLDVSTRPTGQNFYYGGGEGIQLEIVKPDVSDSDIVNGWSWYWVSHFVFTKLVH
jgi:hypothetical protein